MSEPMWYEIEQAMEWLDSTPEARVGVLVGRGKYFTSGIDLAMLMGLGAKIEDDCDGRRREKLRRLILDLQDTLTSIERCRKPVLAAVHGACIGGGIDLITACDMRYCSADAWFTVKEIDVGMTADVGTLQRLPRLSATAWRANWPTPGAASMAPKRSRCAWSTAASIRPRHAAPASWKSPDHRRQVAAVDPRLQGNDHLRPRPQVADGLNYIATWNAAMLMSKDLFEAGAADMQKRDPVFKD
jgi:enoyl-CoA hydratase